MYLWWSLCTIFTRMAGESYRSRLRSLLLYLCYVFRAQINFLVGWFNNKDVNKQVDFEKIKLCWITRVPTPDKDNEYIKQGQKEYTTNWHVRVKTAKARQHWSGCANDFAGDDKAKAGRFFCSLRNHGWFEWQI